MINVLNESGITSPDIHKSATNCLFSLSYSIALISLQNFMPRSRFQKKKKKNFMPRAERRRGNENLASMI